LPSVHGVGAAASVSGAVPSSFSFLSSGLAIVVTCRA